MTEFARVDYKGLPEHGRLLAVLGRRSFHGIDMVVLDSAGVRLCIPADKVHAASASGAGKVAA